MTPREGWWNYYTATAVWSVLFGLAMVGFCTAWATLDWRWLSLCAPAYFAMKFAQ